MIPEGRLNSEFLMNRSDDFERMIRDGNGMLANDCDFTQPIDQVFDLRLLNCDLSQYFSLLHIELSDAILGHQQYRVLNIAAHNLLDVHFRLELYVCFGCIIFVTRGYNMNLVGTVQYGHLSL